MTRLSTLVPSMILGLLLQIVPQARADDEWSALTLRRQIGSGHNPAWTDATAETRQKVSEAETAPDWVKDLRGRTLVDYFPLVTLAAPEHARAVTRLRADLARLHDHFERDRADPALFERTARGLDRFAGHLGYRRLMATSLERADRLRGMTLERVIGDQAARAATRGPGAWARLGALFGVNHLRGATPGASLQIVSHVARWIGRQFTSERTLTWERVRPVVAVIAPLALLGVGVDHLTHSHLVTGFVLGSLWGTVQAGPMAHLMSASTDWFLRPTTEYIKRWSRRRTGNTQQAIQEFYNRFDGADGESKDRVRTATLERDDADIADMTPKMQYNAFELAKGIFIALDNSFNRILTETMNHGRWLLTGFWSDELDTINMVQLGLGQMEAINTDVGVILSPYRFKLIAEGDYPRNERLANGYHDLTKALEKHDWLKDDLTEEMERRVREFIALLEGLRVPAVEIRKIMQLQERRSLLRSGVVTALAINELRYLFFPEANRNMPEKPRRIQRATRHSFRIQHYVNLFKEEIQGIHREMGIRIEGADCDELFRRAAG